MNTVQKTDSVCPPAEQRRGGPPFAPEQVQLWGAEYDRLMGVAARLESTLSAEERYRARRFHFDRHRQEYTVGRGLLRLLLGRYLATDPCRLNFVYNAHGKPSLAESGIFFNVSHSGNRLLCGFTTCRPIGVDIEEVRAGVSTREIAEQNFAPREVEVLRQYPDEAVANFFTYWTCKEAVLKGMGMGISRGLREIDLSPMARESSRSFLLSLDRKPASSWSIVRFNHIPGYASAVALSGGEKRLVYREMTTELLGSLLQH